MRSTCERRVKRIPLTRSNFQRKFERGLGRAGPAYFHMYSVYILKSLKDGKTYTGCTNNLLDRLHRHNSELVNATRHRIPLKLLFSEEFAFLKEARKRESWWKSRTGRRQLRKLFKENNW